MWAELLHEEQEVFAYTHGIQEKVVWKKKKKKKEDNICQPYPPDLFASSYIHLFSHMLFMARNVPVKCHAI